MEPEPEPESEALRERVKIPGVFNIRRFCKRTYQMVDFRRSFCPFVVYSLCSIDCNQAS